MQSIKCKGWAHEHCTGQENIGHLPLIFVGVPNKYSIVFSNVFANIINYLDLKIYYLSSWPVLEGNFSFAANYNFFPPANY